LDILKQSQHVFWTKENITTKQKNYLAFKIYKRLAMSGSVAELANVFGFIPEIWVQISA
jgi:hypothetical protein